MSRKKPKETIEQEVLRVAELEPRGDDEPRAAYFQRIYDRVSNADEFPQDRWEQLKMPASKWVNEQCERGGPADRFPDDPQDEEPSEEPEDVPLVHDEPSEEEPPQEVEQDQPEEVQQPEVSVPRRKKKASKRVLSEPRQAPRAAPKKKKAAARSRAAAPQNPARKKVAARKKVVPKPKPRSAPKPVKGPSWKQVLKLNKTERNALEAIGGKKPVPRGPRRQSEEQHNFIPKPNDRGYVVFALRKLVIENPEETAVAIGELADRAKIECSAVTIHTVVMHAHQTLEVARKLGYTLAKRK